MLLAGEIDVAPISSIEYARNAGKLRLLPRLCVSTEGAVDSIQLITRKPLEQVRSVAITPESATSVVLTRVLLGEVDLVPLDQPADATMLIGDAALHSAFEDPTPHYDLGRLWQERTGLPMVFAVWACRDGIDRGLEELERAHLRSLRYRPRRAGGAGSAGIGRVWLAGRIPRTILREAALPLWPPRAAGAGAVLRAGAPGRRAGRRCRSCASSSTAGGLMAVEVRTGSVTEVLDKACAGERISDARRAALLTSRELVEIGRVAHELRCRRTPADQVTFMIDRNLNYTNICYTDCSFCAFYRRPGDTREGYTLPGR